MDKRTVDDRLREEYFDLLPDARRVVEYLETEVRHHLLPLSLQFAKHEALVVTSRVKGCTSAIDKLRRDQEGGEFNQDSPDVYSLAKLNDLAGVRVQVFPRSHLNAITGILGETFPSWEFALFDNVEDAGCKYHGRCEGASSNVRGEIQVVSRLVGLFWEVEHSAIYKPLPHMKSAIDSPRMKECTEGVMKALRAFEDEFEKVATQDPIDGR